MRWKLKGKIKEKMAEERKRKGKGEAEEEIQNKEVKKGVVKVDGREKEKG